MSISPLMSPFMKPSPFLSSLSFGEKSLEAEELSILSLTCISLQDAQDPSDDATTNYVCIEEEDKLFGKKYQTR